MSASAPKSSLSASLKAAFSKADTFLHAHPKSAALVVAVAANLIGVVFHI